jgi:hypothetical protein
MGGHGKILSSQWRVVAPDPHAHPRPGNMMLHRRNVVV